MPLIGTRYWQHLSDLTGLDICLHLLLCRLTLPSISIHNPEKYSGIYSKATKIWMISIWKLMVCLYLICIGSKHSLELYFAILWLERPQCVAKELATLQYTRLFLVFFYYGTVINKWQPRPCWAAQQHATCTCLQVIWQGWEWQSEQVQVPHTIHIIWIADGTSFLVSVNLIVIGSSN